MTSKKSRDPKQKITPRANAMTETISEVLGIVPCGRLLGSLGCISSGEEPDSLRSKTCARVEFLLSMVGVAHSKADKRMRLRDTNSRYETFL